MSSDTDSPPQPDTIQPLSFKLIKTLTLIAAILLSVVVAGTSGYLLGSRTMQSIPLSQLPPTTSTAQSSVATPSPSSQQPMVAINWKTYTNKELGVSFNYLNNWEVSEFWRDGKGKQVDVMIGSAMSCPSDMPGVCEPPQYIFIKIRENTAKLSLTDYINQNFGQFKLKFTPLTINGVVGLRTDHIPVQFDHENVFVEYKSNIYQIVWMKTLWTDQITKEVFNKFLSTVKFI
jgi:hypothetical protein